MTSKPAGKLFSRIAIAILLTMCIAIMGCGKQAVAKVASDTKAFEAASPEIKANWGKAMSAAASHDYATAILTCRRGLQTQGKLTPPQLTAVVGTITAVTDQMLDAAQKDDQNAIRAIEEVRQGWRPR
jgi:hypothetical protein